MKNQICVLLPIYIGTKIEELELCINSIKAQSLNNFDVLIICDGKIDIKVDEFIVKLISNNSHYSLMRLNENRGLAFAMNEAIKKTNHKYLIRQDADTISDIDRIKLQIHYLENNKNIDVLGSHMLDVTQKEEKYIQSMPLDHKKCFETFKYRNPLNHPTVVFRRSFFEKSGLYPTKFYHDEDSALWLNGFINNCVFSNMSDVLVINKLNKDLLARRKEMKGILSTFLNRIRIIKTLGYGKTAYFSAIIRLSIMCLPIFLLKKIYFQRNTIWNFIYNEK
tara:strand:+ start:281 stop:1117 length:837 start_codon:yes stop_codon:yes gene_type:complete